MEPATDPTFEDYENRRARQDRVEGGLRIQGTAPNEPNLGCPRVSVVTVVRNGREHLEQTIRSVLDQTYENVEYVVIDGASTDGTLEVIQRYSGRIDYWLSERDDGISDAFNKGLTAATGEILSLLNCGDWYEPNAVAKAVQAFEQTGTDVVCGAALLWDEAGMCKECVYLSHPERLRIQMTVAHPATFVLRDAYCQFGLFDLRYSYSMDYDLILRFFTRGAQFHAFDEILTNMRLGGTSCKHPLRGAHADAVIRTALLGGQLWNWLRFGGHLVKYGGRVFLSRIGLGGLVALYRERFSATTRLRVK